MKLTALETPSPPADAKPQGPRLAGFAAFESICFSWLVYGLTMLAGPGFLVAGYAVWNHESFRALRSSSPLVVDVAYYIGSVVLVILWFAIDRPYVLRLRSCLEAGIQPEPLVTATMTPRPKLQVWGIVNAVWWAAHYASVLGLMTLASKGFQLGLPTWTTSPAVPLCFALHFALAYSANGYLLMVLGSAGASDRTLEWAWDKRLLIDAVVAALSVVASIFWST